MKLIIAAPANGTELKNALHAQLAADSRISELRDMSTDASYPQISFAVAQAIAAGEADRAILICGTGIGTAIAANKVAGIRAATAHDLTSVRGAVENYNAQILCMGQNVIAAPAAWALVDIWLNLRHDAHSSYAPKVHEISAFEQQK
ncbi:RpiB/LacA/LacB family sugar-phosphate isomerase [Kingella oralis]|jgi:sugar-phosphate isomerase, RpiB/LacA/LacB family|uniref:RpiB/LacA/LacB family sugar-phosphate isomerase n=1 Tax=Kingella oralis TaxID=505 RepID=UPI002D7F0F5F|nr:RpiB/LacA/LacB family sugar-phosphate isomerase [Kingella oralis]